MPSITRFGHPPRSFWPQVATAVAALLLTGAACADMAGGLLVSPTSLNFGSVALGATSASQQVTVTNTTSAPIGPLSVGSGVSAPWGSGTGCSGVTLAAGTSCSSTYTFTPTALGPQVSSGEGITINGVKVPMSFVGTGVQGLRVTPTSFNFGDVIVNTTSPGQVLTVTNITSAPVTIASSSAGAMAPFVPTPTPFSLRPLEQELPLREPNLSSMAKQRRSPFKARGLHLSPRGHCWSLLRHLILVMFLSGPLACRKPSPSPTPLARLLH